MAKKNSHGGVPPLSCYWTPPARLNETGVGRPLACLATTFEFDAPFFEAELLPRFLGLRFDHTENEPSFMIEREEALASAYVAVLVDQSRLDSSQTTMRWNQIPVHVPGGILHAKITVLAWERFVRVIIGSANLTRKGYRRNREVFAALDFWDAPGSVPLKVLQDTLDLLDVTVGWSRVAPAVRERTKETIKSIRRQAQKWASAPAAFTSRERPRVSLAATHPAGKGHAARSTLAEVIDLWGRRPTNRITVVTPFVGKCAPGDTRDAVIDKLLTVRRTRRCDAYLVVPEKPKTAKNEDTRVPLPEAFGEAWSAAFQRCRGSHVQPVPLSVEGEEGGNRDLHSKAILLEGEDDLLAMVGSSNFTPHGMGVAVYNVEASLVFEDRTDQKRGGITWEARLGVPEDWYWDVNDVIWEETPEPSEDAAADGNVPPGFFAWAGYSQTTGELKLTLDRAKPEPPAWSVRLPGASEDVRVTLFTRDRALESSEATTLLHVFAEDARGVNLVALLVEWVDAEEQTRQGKLGVCVESPESLLPPVEFRKLAAETIIECLISGKSPSLWYDQQQNAPARNSRNDAAIDSLRAVDPSDYLLYRVRRFGRALMGMSDRVQRTAFRPDAMRYRLFNDPFGPVSLAGRILAVDGVQKTNWCARLHTEHRVFLLTEILLTVDYLRRWFQKKLRGKDQKDILAHFDDAKRLLTEQLDTVANADGGELPGNLQRYLDAVRTQVTQQQGAATAVEAKNVG